MYLSKLSYRLMGALLAMAAAAMLLCTTTFAAQDALAENFLRLHVIANSDSAEDQALKLAVRDRVLFEVGTLTENAENVAAARKIVGSRLDELKAAAESVIAAQGYTYPVSLALGDAYFPTKTYGSFALPAGHYDALRVIIGEGAGENWWCVLFPPFCTSAAVEKTAREAGVSEDELSLMINGDYNVRFRLIEWLSELRERLGI